jgi:hypothetical protein
LTGDSAGPTLREVIRDDTILRLVQKLAEAIARIAGLRKAGLLDQAAEELRQAFGALGAIDPRLAEEGDAAVLLQLVQEPARREALARLLAERDALRAARRGAPET